MADINEVVNTINSISHQLDLLGDEMAFIANEMSDKKKILDVWQEQQKDVIRNKQVGGHLKLNNGENIKLTDAMYDSLSRFGQLQTFAEYEALKRRKDALEIAIKAKIGALSGQQSIAKITIKELETLNYQD